MKLAQDELFSIFKSEHILRVYNRLTRSFEIPPLDYNKTEVVPIHTNKLPGIAAFFTA